MLSPLVRLMIRNGITWGEFAELGKRVFVEAARADYGLQGRPTNTARVALMTGLSRREVTRIRKILAGDEAVQSAPKSRISQVLSGWHVDPEFLDDRGAPAELPGEGPAPSLQALLYRYAGDIPHGALLKEMKQLGLVVEDDGGFRVTSRDYVRSAADPDMLRQAGQALHDHATTIVHNVDRNRGESARFERMATQLKVDADTAGEFQRLLETRGQAFLEEMDAWLADRAHGDPEAKPRRKRVRAGVGMYLIYDVNQGTEG